MTDEVEYKEINYMDFKEQLIDYSNLINTELENYLAVSEVPERKLLEAMRYSLEAGGKRIRPALILESYRLFADDYKEALSFAMAMEMVHTFSLIHDDLPAIDNDDYRRGKLTNHKVFGEDTAILAGDGLLNLAYETISKTIDNEKKVNAFKEFSMAVGNMIKGEFVDVDCEGRNIDYDTLLYMHHNKTGALISGSIKIGAILAGADEVSLKRLEHYADNIGITFQIKDDLLSLNGDFKKLGKPIGNDVLNEKCTFVTLLREAEANKILEELTEDAVKIASEFGDKGEFLKNLAIFIKDREY